MKRFLHICMIAHSNSPWAPQYARFWESRGHRVSIISFHPKLLEGLDVHYVGALRGDGSLPKWIYLARSLKVKRLLRRLQPDVVLATYLRSNGLVGALTKCKPLVVSSHGIDQQYALPLVGRRITQFVCDRADFVHVVSQELFDGLRNCNVPPGKMAIIPVGADLATFTPRTDRRPSDKLKIICTRKHEPIYDNMTLIRATTALRHTRMAVECRFVGAGSMTRKLKRAVLEAGLDRVISFVDEVPHAEVACQLQEANIYVSCSRSDGTSSSLLEAISCGLLPVISDIPANRSWVQHKVNGFLFPVGDADRCAEGIRWGWENRVQLAPALEESRRSIAARGGDFLANTARLEAVLRAVANHG